MKTRRIHTLGTIAVLCLALAFSPTASRAQSSDGDGDYQIGPEYKLDPDLTDRGNPNGKYFEFSMVLADYIIFPLHKRRRIYVYVPAAYRDGAPEPILIIHDGPGQLNLVRYALDAFAASKLSAIP